MGAEKASFPVKMTARLLGVSRSGFYEWLRRGEPEDPWLQARIDAERERLESDRRFGARFIWSRLPHLAPCRVREIMRGLGIRGVTPNTRKRTTAPDAGAPERPGLVGRDFTSPVPTCKLVGDITYLRTGQGWLFPSTVIGLNTRMVVGWSLSRRMAADIAAGAPETAWRRGRVAENAVFHSGRGAQYTSRLVAAWAAGHQVRLSVGRAGSCRGDAVAESFSATPKDEMFHLRKWPTRDEARRAVAEFIEPYHNRRRPHSTIGCRIPAEAMDGFFERTAPHAEGTSNQAPRKLARAA